MLRYKRWRSAASGCLTFIILVNIGLIALLLADRLGVGSLAAVETVTSVPIPVTGLEETTPEPQPSATPFQPLPITAEANAIVRSTDPLSTAIPKRIMVEPTQPLPTPAPWTGRERVNILVMGMDQREDADSFDVPRTDTMILLTVDPVTKTAGMVSIPRDLWIYQPETVSWHKINTAYRWGELRRLPGGGPGQAMRAISRLLDVPVHYFVLVDFHAFTGLIDAMDGLDMHIREPITVDPLGPGNTVTLEPGVQTLSGEVALAYARNRSTEFDDFDRTSRQQEVLMAIRDQVVDFNMLPGLVLQAPNLYRELSSNIRTNLTLDQSIRLAWLANQVPEENIRRSAFDFRKDFFYETIDTDAGPQAVLILKPEGIRRIKEELFPNP